MILAVNTATSTCKLWLIDRSGRSTDEWEAGRSLADGLLHHLRSLLNDRGLSWRDISAIAVYKGPGSFTSLRIGLTVLNTIADDEMIPIVGTTGDDWLETALVKIQNKESDGLVMPVYGSEPNITKPRK